METKEIIGSMLLYGITLMAFIYLTVIGRVKVVFQKTTKQQKKTLKEQENSYLKHELDQLRVMTLKDFNEKNMPDGYYALWNSEYFDDEFFVYGFRGLIMKYSEQGGLEEVVGGYPDWLDELPENKIYIKLLEEVDL